MRSSLNQTRLPPNAVSATPKFLLPLEDDLTQREEIWIFKDDGGPSEEDEVRVRVKTHVGLSKTVKHLSASHNTWSGHADVALQN